MRWIPGLVAAGALVLALAWFTDSASAQVLACGQVITKSTKLQSSVGPCPSGGIVIGADRITLDLNGHRVIGVAGTGDGAGIRLTGRTGVVVRNGTVTGFDAGVVIEGGQRNHVTGLALENNVGSNATDFGDGIAVFSSTGNRIEKNSVVANGPFSGISLLGTSSGNWIGNNRVIGNNICRSASLCDDDGIRLEVGAVDNQVIGNTVRGSGLDGIAIFARSPDNVVRGNTVEANGFHRAAHRKGDGIRFFLDADRGLIEQNAVFANAANGIRIDAKSSRILDNRTGDNAAQDPSPPAFDLHDSNTAPPCDNNTWQDNTFETANPACTTGVSPAASGSAPRGAAAGEDAATSAPRDDGGGRRASGLTGR